jgi:hypothetical protein
MTTRPQGHPLRLDRGEDRGVVSRFRFLVSPVAHEDSMKKRGIISDRVVNVGGFADPRQENFWLLTEAAQNARLEGQLDIRHPGLQRAKRGVLCALGNGGKPSTSKQSFAEI